MQNMVMAQLKTIGKINAVVAKAETIDEAVKNGLKEILNGLDIEYAVIWYQDKNGDGNLHPYFWIAPVDLTQSFYAPGQGIVGEVFSTQKAIARLDYREQADEQVDRDFAGIDIASMVCVPLTDNDESLGCVQFLNSADKHRISEDEAEVCEILCLMAAIALDENDKLAVNPWQNRKVILSARGICKEFRNGDIITKVLKGVNLDIYEGEFIAVLGESGCGKSTFLNILGGLDSASSGTCRYYGEDISQYRPEQLTLYRRYNVGFIFQSYNLMSNLTAKQNLDLIGELVDNPLDSLLALRLVGLENKSKSYPCQLSGGQQQRVSIARALVKQPKLIFADEPTAALDYATSIEVLEVLARIAKDGTTLVMVTHNEEIARMADRVVRMRNGKIYEVAVNRHPAAASELVW